MRRGNASAILPIPEPAQAGAKLTLSKAIRVATPQLLYAYSPLEMQASDLLFLQMIVMNFDSGRAMTLGHSVLVTDDGCECLSRSRLDLVLERTLGQPTGRSPQRVDTHDLSGSPGLPCTRARSLGPAGTGAALSGDLRLRACILRIPD